MAATSPGDDHGGERIGAVDLASPSNTDNAAQLQDTYATVNGVDYQTKEELVAALHTSQEQAHVAFEVNEHMKSEIEKQAEIIEQLKSQLASTESSYQKIKDKLRAFEQQPDPDVAEHVAIVDKRMDALRNGAPDSDSDAADRHVWDAASVKERREALATKGAQQGWLRDFAELHMGEVIGAGTFGRTHLAEWRGVRVAAKVTRHPKSAAEATNFLREVECFAALVHPNVLPFLGACMRPPDECVLLTEYMPGGTLRDWLYGRGTGRRPPRALCARLGMALDVAQGMAALEGLQPPIVHRDLKPSNCFVDGAGHARIADMNLSLRLHDDHLATLTGETGTYLYMSPEMMRHELYTTKTDVWSFGVMLVELCNAQTPYESLYLTPLQVAMAVADRKLTPPFTARGVPDAARHLAALCLQQDPLLRPNFVDIVPALRSLIAEVQRRERAAAAAHQSSLLGRVQGMLAGAGAVPQVPRAAGAAPQPPHQGSAAPAGTQGTWQGTQAGRPAPRAQSAAPAWSAKPVSLFSDLWSRAQAQRTR